jgi:hypothetical protein
MRIVAVGLLWVTVGLVQPGEKSLLLPHAVRVSGVVVDGVGNPIPEALVLHANSLGKAIGTDAEGKFAFETNAPAVVIEKPGYRSQRLQAATAQEVRVTLERLSKGFRVCEGTDSMVGMNGMMIGGFFFQKIKGIKATEPKMDVDYLFRAYLIKVGGKRYGVRHGTGPIWGGSEPFDELVWNSEQYEQVKYDVGGISIVDARGVLPDGNRWRNLGSFGVSASYEDVPNEAASVLDRLLDSACWKPSSQK